ncbi:hypothetical protein MKX03_026762 [Papaver bracteatum]|nr:hypothetical protein MKX03_026762 [Papaver bracteatum]
MEALAAPTPPPLDRGCVGLMVLLYENDEEAHAIMTATLPKVFILQSNYNHRYMNFKDDIPELPNALQFAGEYSFDIETRFAVEKSTTRSGLVHIKSLANNRYWSAISPSGPWITAGAENPVEDPSRWSCTLFQPIFLTAADNKTVSFRHIKTGNYACLWYSDPPAAESDCLYIGSETVYPSNKLAEYTIIDWEDIVMLPDRIRIKENEGDKYLKAHENGFMSFNHGLPDPGTRQFDVEYQVYPSRNGGIELRSIGIDKFWCTQIEPPWVTALGTREKVPPETNTIFLPNMINENTITLKCLRDNLFCTIRSEIFKKNGLATMVGYADQKSYMVIEEPVKSRRISNVEFRFKEASIYDKDFVILMTDSAENNSAKPLTVLFDFGVSVTQTSTWNASVSLKLGVTASLTAGVPSLGIGGELKISSEFSGSYAWGKTEETKADVKKSYQYIVEPMKKVKVYLSGTQGRYYVPFSYTQKDVLSDGTTKTYDNKQGWFTGQNSYQFDFKIDSVTDLDAADNLISMF